MQEETLYLLSPAKFGKLLGFDLFTYTGENLSSKHSLTFVKKIDIEDQPLKVACLYFEVCVLV